MGVIESAPFQKMRTQATAVPPAPPRVTDMSTHHDPESKSDVELAERHASLSRRKFFRGVGACHRAAGVRARCTRLPRSREAVRRLAPTRMAFVYVPNGAIPRAWWPAGRTAATGFELSPTLAPLAKVQNNCRSSRGLHDLAANAGPGWRRRSRARQRHVPHRRARQEDRGLGHPRRRLHRPGGGEPDRPPHALLVARAHLRCRAQVRRLRFRLRLRLRIQPRLALAQPAAVARAQSAFRVRTIVRRGRPARTRREPQAPPAEQHSILDYVLEDARAARTASSTAATSRSSIST